MMNLFLNLPLELQIKIIQMNPHPATECFKKALKEEIQYYNMMQRNGDGSYYKGKLWKIVMENDKGYIGYNCFDIDYVNRIKDSEPRRIQNWNDDTDSGSETFTRECYANPCEYDPGMDPNNNYSDDESD